LSKKLWKGRLAPAAESGGMGRRHALHKFLCCGHKCHVFNRIGAASSSGTGLRDVGAGIDFHKRR
jgi:hypothetical protein